MPSPADAPRSQPTAEESFLDLLVETLESLDRSVRGQFLQRFFKSLAQIELAESDSISTWEQILERRRELSESLSKPISLKTAMVDVLASTNFLRVPILVEYDELKKLQINAATDALTGLYNRRLFEEYFNKELNRSKRYGQQLALVLMDLHRFKDVNDKYGHLQGDQALQMAAAALRKTVRASDYAFRIGGDEFALLLPQCDSEQCSVLSRRLRANYESAVQGLKLEVPLALDYGIAVYPEDGDQRDTLLRLADERLYELKKAMRNPPRIVPKEPAPREAAPAPAHPPVVAAPPIPRTPLPGPVESFVRQAAAAERKNTRKWERVSLVGTRAYAVVVDDVERTARVIDLSYGGVALEVEKPEDLPAAFQAVLHVPILPPVKVSLRKTYEQQVHGQGTRVGCAFSS
jgi:diguanylate cyclase (GGDEF)-like protein